MTEVVSEKMILIGSEEQIKLWKTMYGDTVDYFVRERLSLEVM